MASGWKREKHNRTRASRGRGTCTVTRRHITADLRHIKLTNGIILPTLPVEQSRHTCVAQLATDQRPLKSPGRLNMRNYG